jgi:mono/diheme cytochrome c family protein
MPRTHQRRRCGLLALFLTMAGMGPALAQETGVRQRDTNWTAPPKEASKLNPLANRPEVRGGGEKLFGQRCSTCHGGDGRGTSKGPDLTQPDVQAQSEGALFWKISGGNAHAGMPAFSFLPKAQRWQLVLHLRALPNAPLLKE